MRKKATVNILQKIVAHKKKEILQNQIKPPAQVEKMPGRNFHAAIAGKDRIALIAEIKRRSPSCSQIFQGGQFDAGQLAQTFEKKGAAAISVLTDRKFFGGNFDFLKSAKLSTQHTPILAKDFFICQQQIQQAKDAGADAILLIAKILPLGKLRELLEFARKLQLDCLVEIADGKDLRKVLQTPASIVGINNRNLVDFQINLQSTFTLSKKLQGRTIVAMSGFAGNEIQLLKNVAHSVLVGTAISGAQNPGKKIQQILQPRKLLKVCGVRTMATAAFCAQRGVDLAGLNFVENSKRKIDLQKAKQIRQQLGATKAVGIFQDQSQDFVEKAAQSLSLDFVQLHGNENVNFCRGVSRPVIRALKVENEKQLEKATRRFAPWVEIFLFDASAPGSGENFDWQVLANFLRKKNPAKPFLIAGGVKAENLPTIWQHFSKFENFAGVDTASGVESNGQIANGKIQDLLQALELCN